MKPAYNRMKSFRNDAASLSTICSVRRTLSIDHANYQSTMSEFMHLLRPNVTAPAVASASGPASVQIQASALVLVLEILSKQVLPENPRVIGTLLGIRSDDGHEFVIRDAFLVPCTETGDLITIDENSHKTMFALYKKAHPKESVLGWFGSAPSIDSTTSLIHDFYSKGSDRAYPFPAIHLNVDFYDPATKQISTPKLSCYLGAAVGKGTSATNVQIGWKTTTINNSYIFTPVPNSVVASLVTEKIALSALHHETINKSAQLWGNQHPLHFLLEIQAAQRNIDTLLKFVEQKTKSTEPLSDSDTDLLRLLSNLLLTKPQILTNMDSLDALFRSHNEDVIMIEYLTKAVKEQIELSARLTASAETDKKN